MDVQRQRTGLLPIVTAVQSGRAEIVVVLLEAGADTTETIFDAHGYGGTAMDEALKKKNPSLVQVLLNAGAELPAITKWPLCKGVYEVLRRAKEEWDGTKIPEWKVFRKMFPGEIANLRERHGATMNGRICDGTS
jgi:hypothetical protein